MKRDEKEEKGLGGRRGMRGEECGEKKGLGGGEDGCEEKNVGGDGAGRPREERGNEDVRL